jgi:hypothetical protein
VSGRAWVPSVAHAEPTAWQFVVDTHETPKRLESVPATLGLGVTDHVLPFHRSVSVLTLDAPYAPTAKQLVVVGHEMPSRPE